MHRGTIFVLGTYLTYFVCGLGLILGFESFMKIALSSISKEAMSVTLMLLGVALVCYAIYSWSNRPQNNEVHKRPLKSGLSILVFAVFATFTDMPSAIPYFAAIKEIEGLGANAAQKVFYLVLYNIGYVSPLVMLLAIRMHMQKTLR